MTRAELDEIKDLPILAIKSESAFTGIGILKIDENEVISCELYEDRRLKYSKTRIYYNNSGEPYFNKGGYREYLKDYLRTNI